MEDGALAKGDDIQERLIDFAVESIRLSSTLNGSKEQRHVAGQILRSGTSPAPNYGDARAAESDNDFVHKLKVVLKELNETGVWLEIIRRSGMATTQELAAIGAECDELSRIIGARIRTVNRRNSKSTRDRSD